MPKKPVCRQNSIFWAPGSALCRFATAMQRNFASRVSNRAVFNKFDARRIPPNAAWCGTRTPGGAFDADVHGLQRRSAGKSVQEADSLRRTCQHSTTGHGRTGKYDQCRVVLGTAARCPRPADRGRPESVVRRPVDAIAATFVAASLQRAADRTCVAVEHASGLMALSAATTLARDAGTDTIILSTVGGVENRHLRLLVKRAQRDFPAARLLVCDWGAEEESLSPSSEPAGVRSKVIRKLSEVTTVLAYRSTNDGVATSRVKDRNGQADLVSEMTVA